MFPVVVSPPDKPQVWSPFSDRGATERIPTGETAGVDPYEQCGGLIIAKDPAGAANYTPIVASRNFRLCLLGEPVHRHAGLSLLLCASHTRAETAEPTTAKPTSQAYHSQAHNGGRSVRFWRTTPGRQAQPTAAPTTSATEPKTQEPISPSAESATGR